MSDAKTGIITAADVTRQENDTGQLVPMIVQAQENVGVAGKETETWPTRAMGPVRIYRPRRPKP